MNLPEGEANEVTDIDQEAIEPLQSHVGRLAVAEVPQIAGIRGGVGAELGVTLLRDLVEGSVEDELTLDDLHAAVDEYFAPLLAGPHPGVIDVQVSRWAEGGYARTPVLIKVTILSLAGRLDAGA